MRSLLFDISFSDLFEEKSERKYFIGLKGRKYYIEDGQLRSVKASSKWYSGKQRWKKKGKRFRGEKPKLLNEKVNIFFKRIMPRLSFSKIQKNARKTS